MMDAVRCKKNAKEYMVNEEEGGDENILFQS